MSTRLRAFTLFFFLFFGASLLAAPGPPPGGGGTPPCWPPPCIPIDGGIGLLMAAGAAYGARKLYRGRQKTS